MSQDPAGLDETRRGMSKLDRIGGVAERPLPVGARDRLASLAPPHRAAKTVYLSTPITTGPRLLDWLSKNAALTRDPSSIDVVREEVVRENLGRLAPLRDRVRFEYADACVIDPTVLEEPEWSQSDYHRFWVEVLRAYVDVIVFADGWELSTGCTVEYATALELGLPCLDAKGEEILPALAAAALREASAVLINASRDGSIARDAARRAEEAARVPLKDLELAALAESYNIASFLSFTPGKPFVRRGIIGSETFRRAAGVEGSIKNLLSASRSGSVNVRTFRPGVPKGNPFHYGLSSVGDVVELVKASASSGFHCIVNETIDIHDGGVSGVTLGGIAEFAPDDTPRAVESRDTAQLPLQMASHILGKVYGSQIILPADKGRRIEFSVHPRRVGHRHENVIVWETEEVSDVELETDIRWPNRFSELIGDKTFGLLVADAVGVPVPETTVVNRRVAPFRFGRSTGTKEWWLRTAPARQAPGHFTTMEGWSDPFALLGKEDPQGRVSAVLSQEGVDARFSGATLPRADGKGHIIEGVAGTGDDFMLGMREPSDLPGSVTKAVTSLLSTLEGALGPGIRIEWAADARRVWVLQLHRVRGGSEIGVFNPGAASVWLPFDPSQGLEALAGLIAQAQETGAGVEVTGAIGLTSHVGDLLRKAGVPGRLRVGSY